MTNDGILFSSEHICKCYAAVQISSSCNSYVYWCIKFPAEKDCDRRVDDFMFEWEQPGVGK